MLAPMNRLTGLARLCAVLTWFALVSAAQSPATDEPVANPGRPTVSTPAALTPLGYLQFETGFLHASHSPEFSSRSSLNETIKLSVVPRLEFLASSEPVVRYTSAGRTAYGVAEVFLGAQAVVSPGTSTRWEAFVGFTYLLPHRLW
jgi:hypothetical protein